MPEQKIKFQAAKDIESKIKRLESELMEAYKLADSMGMELTQHTCKGTLDRYKYHLTGVKVYPDDLEI